MAVPLLSKKTVKKRVKKFKQPQSDRKISVKVILLVFILALCIRLWSKGMATATPSGVGIASRVISPCRSISHLLCLFLLMLKQTSLIVGTAFVYICSCLIMLLFGYHDWETAWIKGRVEVAWPLFTFGIWPVLIVMSYMIFLPPLEFYTLLQVSKLRN
ncbi:uncharacterized protein [Coffea arabica]|uniref:Uncharacterized protein isoform X3 n=1 Tax=Coffea arabica TaxID=13443 RepID=A0ABM4UNP5_COFAR